MRCATSIASSNPPGSSGGSRSKTTKSGRPGLSTREYHAFMSTQFICTIQSTASGEFTTHPRGGGSRQVDFALLDSREALQWTVQMNCIDMNVWYSRVDKPHRPDYVVFDLDPPDEPDGFALAIEVAHVIRGLLDEVGLPGYVKTSGADGIHVLAPIQRRAGFDDTYAFAEAASRLLEQRHPGKVTTEWLKKKRSGVLLDHRQNGWGKTIASVYSVRPKPGAPVSTPLRWDELTQDVRPRDFGMEAVLERVERHGDLFAPVLEDARPLGAAARELARLVP